MITRRRFLQNAGAGCAAVALSAAGFPAIARAAAPFVQPDLPFAEDALAPAISARTIGLHYGKHHAAYFNKLNELIAGTPYSEMALGEVVRTSRGKEDDRAIFNNAGQAWNHVFYWEQFTPGGAKAPQLALKEAIERDFDDFDAFKAAFVAAAGNVFGSGWTWLVRDGDTLAIEGTPGGDSPFAARQTPLLGIDVWEHAYYLDYENRRAEHVKAVLDNIVNWDVVAARMRG